jgi:hypothetical protein
VRTDLHLDDPALAAWRIEPGSYPGRASLDHRLRFVVRYAVLAPSSHNTQPWTFRITTDDPEAPRGTGVIEVRADRSRGLAVVDHEDRELTMSVGAALETLVVAARHLGLTPGVALRPDRHDGDLLAVVTVGDEAPSPDPSDDGLFEAIVARRTTRLPFEARPLPDDLVAQVRADAVERGVELEVIDGGGRTAIADLVAEADRLQMADQRFRRELAAWMRFNHSVRGDGIRGYGFGFPAVMSAAGPLFVRTFDLGDRQGARDEELASGAPALAILSTADDDVESWLATGRALQRVLLRLTAGGATASFLNQPIEVPSLRSELSTVAGIFGLPQILLRVGFGPPVPAEPRRPFEDVLLDA